jgi:3-phosphoshikimate 1-carboxyvinyltransferase
MKAVLQPGRTEGSVIRIPSSKSIGHRALIAAALSQAPSRIRGLDASRDIAATMGALAHLGARFERGIDGLNITPVRDLSAYDGKPVDCGESGSTLRFLIPLFSLCGKPVTFTGRGRLLERPQDVYAKLFADQKLPFEQTSEHIRICGPLRPDSYRVPGDVSSQFISGLLFALPLLTGASHIEVLPPYESRSYVDLSRRGLAQAGIAIRGADDALEIPGGQVYQAGDQSVEGDDSQMAFFAGLAAVSGIGCEVTGMNRGSIQADHAVLRILKEMGLGVETTEGGYRFHPGPLKAATIDLGDCPDLGPVLFAAATQAQGTSEFLHVSRLRIKESDRIACMQEELAKLGARMKAEEDRVIIEGRTVVHPAAELDGHNDHRIVMALSVLASAADAPVTIRGIEAVEKSYPAFYEDLAKAGMKVEVLK